MSSCGAEWQINRKLGRRCRRGPVPGGRYDPASRRDQCELRERGTAVRVVTMRAASETGATLPALLSLNAGYVDTASYLALQGLFTRSRDGQFVTLGASLALGTSGAVAKLLALPTFVPW